MPRPLTAQTTFSTNDLAKIAKREPNARVRQRLLAVRLVVMANTVPQAAKAVGLKERQTRNWIHRFNAEGINGLRDRPRPGQPVKLARQKEPAFRERIEKTAGPKNPTANLRVKDIQRILREEFDADYCLGGTYFLLHRLGFSSLVARPRHPQADQQAQGQLKKMLKEWVQRTRKLHPGKKVCLWFQDEGRFGQQGTISRVWGLKGKRAYAPKQTDFEWVYVFGAVCPATGQTHGCLISFADTSAMNGYLKDFSKHVPADEHVLMTLDRAGWHRSKSLCIAENLTLLLLPAYSPELNPVELLWWQMRDKHLSNQVFEPTDQMDKDVAKAWCTVTGEPETVRSLCLFPWIESAINN